MKAHWNHIAGVIALHHLYHRIVPLLADSKPPHSFHLVFFSYHKDITLPLILKVYQRITVRS